MKKLPRSDIHGLGISSNVTDNSSGQPRRNHFDDPYRFEERHATGDSRTSWYTDFVRNVTITLDEETARWARVEAARSDTSVSRWVGQLLEERRQSSLNYERARSRYLQRSGAPLKQPGTTLPSRDELHRR